MPGLEMQVRKAFVVAQHHVEARPVFFDQIEFQQQRFGVGIRDRDLHARSLGNQCLNLGMHVAGLEIRSDPALEIARLADIEDLALGVQHPVNTRAARQALDVALRVEWCPRSFQAVRRAQARALCR